MIRRALVVLALALAASACGNSQLGLSVPVCPADPQVISAFSGAIMLEMQAVETAEFVPCLNDLNAGWSYEDLVPERGLSRFWLDSDRLGSHFLEVTLTPACDVSSASLAGGRMDDAVTEFRDVELIGSNVTIVIVPVTGQPAEAEHARSIESELEARQINDRNVFVVFDTSDDPLADKVAVAARRDRPMIIVDEQDALAKTATLQMPGESQSVRGLELNDLLDRLDDLLPKPSFVGTWYRVFEGGCITYEFDASGPGVDRLAGDVEDALGLFPAAEVRQALRSAGLLG